MQIAPASASPNALTALTNTQRFSKWICKDVTSSVSECDGEGRNVRMGFAGVVYRFSPCCSHLALLFSSQICVKYDLMIEGTLSQ